PRPAGPRTAPSSPTNRSTCRSSRRGHGSTTRQSGQGRVAEGRTIELRVKRQDGPGAPPYWQSFAIPWKAQHNVISALMEVRTNPVTTAGERVPAPAWEASCLEEVCGSCAMLVNGQVRMG